MLIALVTGFVFVIALYAEAEELAFQIFLCTYAVSVFSPMLLLTFLSSGRKGLALWFMLMITCFYVLIFLPNSNAILGFLLERTPQPFSVTGGETLYRLSTGAVAYLVHFSIVGLLIIVLPISMLLLSPLTSVTRRLSFLLIGLMILVGLNELSKYAPIIRTWLGPSS
jgi:hypothetical protein